MINYTARFAFSLLAVLAFLQTPADATKKKPSKKAQKAECNFQLDRCEQNCLDNFQWKDPNAKGNQQIYDDCKNRCIGENETCEGNIKFQLVDPPMNTMEPVPENGAAQP